MPHSIGHDTPHEGVKARLVARIKETYGRGTIEGVVWEVPAPAQPSVHRIKYRLVYIVGG